MTMATKGGHEGVILPVVEVDLEVVSLLFRPPPWYLVAQNKRNVITKFTSKMTFILQKYIIHVTSYILSEYAQFEIRYYCIPDYSILIEVYKVTDFWSF
jgi:hypothetical protein